MLEQLIVTSDSLCVSGLLPITTQFGGGAFCASAPETDTINVTPSAMTNRFMGLIHR